MSALGRFFWPVVVAALHTAAGPAPAQATAATPAGALPEPRLRAARQTELTSAITHKTYSLQIFIPPGPPPARGFPVSYLLDSGVLFVSFAIAALNRDGAAEIDKTVIVGIDSGSASNAARRTYDFTPFDLTAQEKALVKDLAPNPPPGGYDAFLCVIEQEIEPFAVLQAPVDGSRKALFGWSLIDLFVVNTPLVHPDAFQSYVAISPLLWRSDRAVFRAIPGFERMVQARALDPRLFLAVGTTGEDPKARPITGMFQEDWAAETRYARMRTNMLDLQASLAKGFAVRGDDFEVHVFEWQTHTNVVWTALNPLLDFLAGRPPRGQER